MKSCLARHPAAAPLGNEQGFTLIEVMAALAIFSIVAVAIFTLFRQAMASKAVTAAANEKMSAVQRTLAILDSDLSGARRFSLAEFHGESDSLRFAALTQASGGERHLSATAYVRVRDAAGESAHLVRRVWDFRGGSHTTPLLPEVTGLRFSYLGLVNKTARWLDRWPNPGEMPLAVRIQVQTALQEKPIIAIYPVRAQ